MHPLSSDRPIARHRRGRLLGVLLLIAASASAASASPAPRAPRRPAWRLTGVFADAGHAEDMACLSVSSCVVLGSTNHTSYAPGDGVTLAPTSGFAARLHDGVISGTVHGLQAADAIACSAPTCVTVGGSASGLLADELGGGAWRPLPVHGPRAPYGEALDSVACIANGRCFAVGITQVQTTRTCSDGANTVYCYANVPVVESLRDRRWRAFLPRTGSRAAVPPNARSAVACGGPHLCVAIFPNATGGVASIWRGGAWTRPSRLPLDGRPGAELTALSCTASGTCLAVGSYLRGGRRVALALLRVRSGWHLSTPAPTRLRATYFADVACAQTGGCIAVGGQTSAAGREAPLVERFAGGSWSLERTPRIHAGAQLSAVACVTSDLCEAVGDYGPATRSSWFVERYGTPPRAAAASKARGFPALPSRPPN